MKLLLDIQLNTLTKQLTLPDGSIHYVKVLIHNKTFFDTTTKQESEEGWMEVPECGEDDGAEEEDEMAAKALNSWAASVDDL